MNGRISQGLHRPIPRHSIPNSNPPPPNLFTTRENSFDEESISTDNEEHVNDRGGPLSINGMEPISSISSLSMSHMIVPDGSPQSLALRQPRIFKNDDFDKAVERVWDDMGNKALPAHEPQMMVKQLEKAADEPVRRTYMEGQPCSNPQVLDDAVVLKVGITFMAGADKPQVNRLEQFDMSGKQPDQQNNIWRVHTAASLLSVFEVDKGLAVVQLDQTAVIAEQARLRRDKRASMHFGHSMAGFNPGALTALTASRPFGGWNSASRCVTIDSTEVKIVNDLREKTEEWDIESTLIEVDGTALMSLMVHYRQLIFKGGPEMTFDETRNLLDTMIEDARRLCVRSPILFRMSTRSKIMNSKNTRYGINTPEGFHTLTTSKGIQETISLSAAYFNSLDPTSSEDKTQAYIRPRFLQMVVLLLSLLNDDDLNDMSVFLETTYGLKAERKHLELLFLKVIPLMSINSMVFLKAMIPAFEGWPLQEPINDNNYSQIWSTFIKRILDQGYLLPGTVEMLGSDTYSWIHLWPREGFKSSLIFDNLQYQGAPGSHAKTFNDIPPIEIRPEASYNELNVFLTDAQEYILDSRDLELVTCMITGTYSVQEAKDGGRRYDLIIQERVLNQDINEATELLNMIIRKANQWLTAQKRTSGGLGRRLSKAVRGQKAIAELTMLEEQKMASRLTQHEAYLNKKILGITYKTDGRRITKRSAMRELARDRTQIVTVVKYYTDCLDSLEMRSSVSEIKALKHELDRIVVALNRAEGIRQSINETEKLSDEPIAKVQFPGGTGSASANIWQDYQAWLTQNLLHIDSKRSIVEHILWRGEDLCDVKLEGFPLKYTVKPLKAVTAVEKEDEIRVRDVALLLGQFLVIAESAEGGDGSAYRLTNYLRIMDVEEQVGTRRGRNRGRGVTENAVSIII